MPKFNFLGTLRSLMRFVGFFDPKVDRPTTGRLLTVWFYFVNFTLTMMSTQCIVQLVLDENKDIGQMCYVISMSGVIFGASMQAVYLFFNKKQILELFEVIDRNFEYTSETGLDEIDMKGYVKMGMSLIYWWSFVLVGAVVFLVGSPLSVLHER